MRHLLVTKGWMGQILVIGMTALILGAGLCLFDGVQPAMGHHGMSPDLCAWLLAFGFTLILLGLAEIHGVLVGPGHSVYFVSLRRLDHPPKLFSAA